MESAYGYHPVIKNGQSRQKIPEQMDQQPFGAKGLIKATKPLGC
ncbi:hypothetical protein OHAE_5071 [Ochrobactrum soli]|uniref:Uncharacterized protein n=1 Tax=Ochrobactrum soli TaxID=2448455 RepID=A0A2P9HDU6_9HYPH|nr:hypothetical protein OHAE_5071 [[Ochrobactrum] soli]